MSSYRVCFYKTALSSEGHNFKHLLRQIEVQSASPSEALVLAERQIEPNLMDADCVEVMHISPSLHSDADAHRTSA